MNLTVHFKPEAEHVLPAELALLEAILPEIIQAMMELQFEMEAAHEIEISK